MEEGSLGLALLKGREPTLCTGAQLLTDSACGRDVQRRPTWNMKAPEHCPRCGPGLVSSCRPVSTNTTGAHAGAKPCARGRPAAHPPPQRAQSERISCRNRGRQTPTAGAELSTHGVSLRLALSEHQGIAVLTCFLERSTSPAHGWNSLLGRAVAVSEEAPPSSCLLPGLDVAHHSPVSPFYHPLHSGRSRDPKSFSGMLRPRPQQGAGLEPPLASWLWNPRSSGTHGHVDALSLQGSISVTAGERQGGRTQRSTHTSTGKTETGGLSRSAAFRTLPPGPPCNCLHRRGC